MDAAHLLHCARLHDPHAAVLAQVPSGPVAPGLDRDVPGVGVVFRGPAPAVARHHPRLVGVVGLADRLVQRHRIVEHPEVVAARIQPLVGRGPDPQGGIQPGQVAIGTAATELRRQHVAV